MIFSSEMRVPPIKMQPAKGVSNRNVRTQINKCCKLVKVIKAKGRATNGLKSVCNVQILSKPLPSSHDFSWRVYNKLW